MRCGAFRRLAGLWLLAAIMAAVGCTPQSPPTSSQGSGSDSSKAAAGDGLKDNADDVAALKAAKATLTMDSTGHVVAIDLDTATGGDADLKHLKGLPHVRTLNATEVRRVTDAGLAFLAGHPGLRVIKLERTSVTDDGMPQLQKIPNLDDLDIRRLGITVAGYKEIGKIIG